jgi:hypothetical protein
MDKLPNNVKERALAVLEKLTGRVGYELCAGHPTKKDLVAGFKIKKGKSYPVSKFNVLVDKLCSAQSKKLIEENNFLTSAAVLLNQ